MNSSSFLRTALLLSALCLLPPHLPAQTSAASLAGTVEDEQERLVGGARLLLRDQARGSVRQAETDTGGAFRFSHLAPGRYELTAERSGFAPLRVADMVLHAGDQRTVRLRLRVAPREEAVVVTAEAPLLQEGASVATTVDRGFVANQPLNGRSFQALITLAPGVVLMPASLPSQGQFSVNGQRTGTNYFTVDGVAANFGLPFATTPYEGAGGGVPSLSSQGSTAALASVDAVEEFTIQTSTYAPEYGRQPGAQVAIVTRSGTNSLHGNLFNYLRNDRLDANSWFGNYHRLPRPALRQNDFGFTLGGPVRLPGLYDGRNRTFFFASYEGLRLVQPVISVPSRVPSLEARQRATGLLKAILDAYPLPVAPPLPEAPLETPYVAGFSNPSTLNAVSVRFDHLVTERLTAFVRINHAPSENWERGRYATPSFIAVLPALTQTLTGGATLIASPALTGDFRLNWSRSRASQIYEQDTFGGAKILAPELIFPPFAKPETSLFYLTIGANDENTISPGTFSRNTQRQWNLVQTTSWNRGAHAVKFGADLRRLAPSIGGRLYGKTLVFPSITALTSGIVPTAEIRQVDNYLEPRYLNFSAFVQDTWRIRGRLTLTYGLRWEVNPAPSEANGNLPLTLTGIEDPPSARLAPRGTKLYRTSWDNLAPRLGISWQPFRSQATVIRAGVGIFYDLGYGFTGTALVPTNYPFSRIRSVSSRAIDDPVFYSEVGPQSYDPPYPRLFDFYDDFKLPYSWQYSFTVEQPLGRANTLSVGYVGSAGRRLARVESLRPQTLKNPNFTRVDVVNNFGYSDYHSLQAHFRRRMARHVEALLSYTWAKSLDTASDESISNLAAPARLLDPSSDRGPSAFDVRHSFAGAASYEFPAFRGQRALHAIFGGFALDAVVRVRTAPPVTVITGRDPLGLGLTNVARPDLVAGQPLYLYSSGYPGGKRINPAAFDGATPLAQTRQGTLGRGALRGFGLSQTDLSLRRRFRLTEALGLDLRADAFNVFNTPNFAPPVAVLTNTNFGRATQIFATASVGGLNPLFQLGGPRSIQLSLKLHF
jgi:hypothetical protein